MSTFKQFNETDRLKKVIIGRTQGYASHKAYVEIVNEEQKKGLPGIDQLTAEFRGLQKVLEEHGVEVIVPHYVGKFVYDQLTPRDIGITIGNKFVISNMVKPSRRYEAAGIFACIDSMQGDEPAILIPTHHEMLIEGGDIIIDKGNLFVGISQRTNQAGFEYLKKMFENSFESVPVYCRSLKDSENILHLDCTFNIVGENHALIYPDGFKEIPKIIEDNYHWITIDTEEQKALATNIISIDRKTVISRDHPKCRRVNQVMREAGINVIEIPFNAAPLTGGSFRCCTLPLVREG